MVRKTKKIIIELEKEIDIDIHQNVEIRLNDDTVIKEKVIIDNKNKVFKLSPEIYYRHKDFNKIDMRMYFTKYETI